MVKYVLHNSILALWDFLRHEEAEDFPITARIMKILRCYFDFRISLLSQKPVYVC